LGGGCRERRFDVDVEMRLPVQMHFKMEDGAFSFLTASGKWVSKELSPEAMKHLEELSDRHAGNAGETRKHFDVKRLKSKDNLWGTKKGLVFVPRGKAKLYARREEQVDVESGQPVLVEHYDDSGKCVWRMKVHKLGKHGGMTLVEDVETESFSAAGRVVERTTMTNVEVENEP
jgi:hypothetical protein